MATPVVFEGSERVPADRPPAAVTIGNFDGVHLGHRALIDAARRWAAVVGGPTLVLTFDPMPRDVMAPQNGVPHVQRREDRIAWLGRCGADVVVVEPFTRAMAVTEPRDFVQEVLARRLGAAAVVVGWDFRFGRDRRGDGALVRDVLGVPVEVVDAVLVDGEPVSSTRIRRLVEAGEVAAAAALLGRPHELVGRVEHGDARGRAIGFPTANVDVHTQLLPAHGVYAVRASVAGGPWRDAVANLGRRPTFGGDDVRLEVHLLDGGEDLYGRELRVAVLERLRGERTFDGVQALTTQIRADVEAAAAVLAAAPPLAPALVAP